MNRWQSIISAIVTAILIFLFPYLNRNGIIIEESTATTIIFGILSGLAFLWALYKNHNITQAALEAQKVLNSLKTTEEEPDEIDEFKEM